MSSEAGSTPPVKPPEPGTPEVGKVEPSPKDAARPRAKKEAGPATVRALPDARTAPDPRAAVDAVRKMRRSRALRLAAKLAAFVLLPTLVAAFYFAFWASDQHESTSLFTIQAQDARPSVSMEGLIGLPASPTTRDTLAVRDFVLSRDMLGQLDRETGLIAHFKSREADWFSRLSADASFEDAFEDYLERIHVDFDSNSGVLTLRVRTYSAQKSERVSQVILEKSEAMVNRLAERARQDQTRFASLEVEKAEIRLKKAREQLVELQQSRGEFNPEQSAAAALSIRTQLEAEMAKARAEVAALRSYMAADAPQVIAANEKVRSLAGQAASESQRLVNPKGEKGLNASLAAFESVVVEKEFATQAYQSTLASLELARSDAVRQHRYLARITEPSLSDEAQYPRRFFSVFTAFVASFLLFGIGSLVVAAVREHARL